ncbi:Dynein light chain, partial [Phytophthora palmivora]
MAKRRQSIEVFRLRLRETVNEGDDGSTQSLASLPEKEPLLTPESSPKAQEHTKEKKKRQEKTVTRRNTPPRAPAEIKIDDDSDEEFVAGQEIKIDDDSEEEDIDGREPNSPSTVDAGAIEAVAQLDETVETTESNALEEVETADFTGRLPSVSEPAPMSQPKDNIRESRRVVLVTRPSQREIEMWTERATSTMVKSTESNARPTPTSAQSRRWVLEYKPVVRHSGWLIKRGHGLRNFKRRLFCIVDNELIYHDTHDATEVRGRLDLTRKSTIQCMLHSGFKFSQGSYGMVLYALDNHDRDVWIRKLQEHNVQLLPEGAKTAKLMKQHSDNADKPILFSGWLRKRGRMVKSTKRRWFELSANTLSYYAHPQGGSRKGSIDVTHAR